MLTFRKNIIDIILQSPDTGSIESMLYNSMQCRFEKRTNFKSRFIQWLESDLNFHLRQSHSEKEQRNLIEALRVIKTDFNTIEKKL